MPRRNCWGGWNDELRVEAHPVAYQGLVDLASAAAVFLAKPGRRDSAPAFARWLSRRRRPA